MTRQLLVFGLAFGTPHANQLNGTQCLLYDKRQTFGTQSGQPTHECGLTAGDCCQRCFDQRTDCVAVDLRGQGCCYYFKEVLLTAGSWFSQQIIAGSTPTPPPAPVTQGRTKLSDDLNSMISWSWDVNSVYTAGKGIMVRSPFDGYEDDEDKTVVPATFWVNDIMAPSQLYPGSGAGNGNPWCPTNDAPWSCDADGSTGDMGPWNYVQMAVVVGSKMNELFHDFDNVQSPDWGWGVFYATDSNAVDQRCRWLPEFSSYDCPGGWLPWLDDFQSDGTKKGAGWYAQGNPQANSNWGGGAGCHFGGSYIDQTNAYDNSGSNLVQDEDCQCNYDFSGDWGNWVDNWVQNGLGGKSFSWAADIGMCWMNNVRDMINLQNSMWWKHKDWNNQRVPIANYGGSSEANRPWWGWNEIPMNRKIITDHNNWDAVMIKLPAGACGTGIEDTLDCLDSKYYPQLEADLKMFVDANKLGVGQSSTPSSNLIIAREFMDDNENFFREFFCQQWTHGQFKIVFKSIDDDGLGACYLDNANSETQV